MGCGMDEATKARIVGGGTCRRRCVMPDTPLDIAEIEDRIGVVRTNLRELLEQAAAYSGAADEDLMSRRIAEQEAELERLTRRRDQLLARQS
jgi:hypothetical protein